MEYKASNTSFTISALSGVGRDFVQLNAQDIADRFTAAVKAFKYYADLGACAPYPTRSSGYFEESPEPYLGTYFDDYLPLSVEFRLRQGLDLSRHLQSDAGGLSELAGNPENAFELTHFDLDQLSKRRQALEAKLVALKSLKESDLATLQLQPTAAKVVFDSLCLSTPDTDSTTPISAQCLDFLKIAGINLSLPASPLTVYQALSKNLLEHERIVIEISQKILRDELHVVRMEFYEEMGKALQSQARVAIDEYAESEDAEPLHSENEIFIQLQNVLADPLNAAWPAPRE